MEIVCLDMEGTLTEEIWEKVAYDTGIEDLGKTTRDIPSYEDLLDMRIEIMSKEGIGLSDVQKAASSVELLPGALEFVSNLRKNFQVFAPKLRRANIFNSRLSKSIKLKITKRRCT